MKLWKVEVYDNVADTNPSRCGVMAAKSEDQAREIIMAQMGIANRVDATTVGISEIHSLPEGQFYWKADQP